MSRGSVEGLKDGARPKSVKKNRAYRRAGSGCSAKPTVHGPLKLEAIREVKRACFSAPIETIEIQGPTKPSSAPTHHDGGRSTATPSNSSFCDCSLWARGDAGDAGTWADLLERHRESRIQFARRMHQQYSNLRPEEAKRRRRRTRNLDLGRVECLMTVCRYWDAVLEIIKARCPDSSKRCIGG